MVDKACATQGPCIPISLSNKDTQLIQGEMLGFLIEPCIESDDITRVTVYDVTAKIRTTVWKWHFRKKTIFQ